MLMDDSLVASSASSPIVSVAQMHHPPPPPTNLNLTLASNGVAGRPGPGGGGLEAGVLANREHLVSVQARAPPTSMVLPTQAPLSHNEGPYFYYY